MSRGFIVYYVQPLPLRGGGAIKEEGGAWLRHNPPFLYYSTACNRQDQPAEQPEEQHRVYIVRNSTSGVTTPLKK